VDASVKFYIAVGTAILLVMAIFVIIFVAYYQQKQGQQQLAIKAMEERHQRELMAATFLGQEEERKRLAQDLHDEIGTMLSVTKISLNQLERRLSPTDVLLTYTDKTRTLLSETMSNVRRISRNLVPTTLERFGLLAALEELTERVSEGDVRVSLNCPNAVMGLDRSLELMFFRIAQELVNNAIKHANATQIRLVLHCTPEAVQLSVIDNGQGFDLTAIRRDARRGLGLRNVESRLSVVRGQVNFDVAPGRGSQIHVRLALPVEAQTADAIA
jgi:two-component system, NarL family, sensor kinase